MEHFLNNDLAIKIFSSLFCEGLVMQKYKVVLQSNRKFPLTLCPSSTCEMTCNFHIGHCFGFSTPIFTLVFYFRQHEVKLWWSIKYLCFSSLIGINWRLTQVWSVCLPDNGCEVNRFQVFLPVSSSPPPKLYGSSVRNSWSLG